MITKAILAFPQIILIFMSFHSTAISGLDSFTPKVVLYSGSSGGRSFTSVAKNHPDLAEVNFDNVAKSACMTGTWIFYGSKNYHNFSDGVATYHFSKDNGCIQFKELSQRISSIRFAGSAKDFRQDYIDLFSGVFFTGIHLWTNGPVANLSAQGLPTANSAIVSGSSRWTLFSNEGFTGTKKCVQPKAGQVPRFYRNSLDLEGFVAMSVRKGC